MGNVQAMVDTKKMLTKMDSKWLQAVAGKDVQWLRLCRTFAMFNKGASLVSDAWVLAVVSRNCLMFLPIHTSRTLTTAIGGMLLWVFLDVYPKTKASNGTTLT
jgi:hypothetical protein